MKYLLASVAILISATAFAMDRSEIVTINKSMQCAPTKAVFDEFLSKFGETPLWIGKEENSYSYITMLNNKQTGTWTLVQHDSNMACILGSGKNGDSL